MEDRTASYVVLSPNPPAVGLHDRAADREPHPQTFRLSAKKRFKHAGQITFGNPFPGILHHQFDAATYRAANIVARQILGKAVTRLVR
jgi:hypothetical protein